MEKDFTQFGGWLKFFNILFWINFIICCLAIPTTIYFGFSDNPELVELLNGVDFVESIITGLVCWFVITKTKIRTPDAHRQMHYLVGFLVIAIFLFSVLKALLSGDPPWDAYDYPNHVLVPLAFTLYLSQSKRVQIYYQLPKEEKATIKIDYEESKAIAHGMVRMFSIGMVLIFGIMAFTGVIIHAAQ